MLFSDFNRTTRDFPDDATIHYLIEKQISMRPSQPAVICDHDTFIRSSVLTYRELNEKANQVAHLLRSTGAGPDKIIGISVERSFAMMIGLLAILKSGSAYLPVPPAAPTERTRYILKDANAAVILTERKFAGSFGGRIILLDDPAIYVGRTDNPEPVNKSTDLAYVMYTSGSTGKPKGVMIEHRSVVNRLHWMQSAYTIGSDDVILQKTPFNFDVSVWECFWWAISGARMCFLPPGCEGFPLAIIETVRKHHVSVLHFVPSMLSVFLDYLEGRDTKTLQSLASVRQVFASGETLNVSHLKKFNKVFHSIRGARLSNLYGPTEATVDVTYFDCPEHNEFERVPIGRPIDNTRLYILKGKQLAAIGEAGELCIGGVGLARGYINNPKLTEEKFVTAPVEPYERIYQTGDIARWMEDGTIEFLGREDDQVKIRGLRIELGEIENTISSYPEVSDCVVTAKAYSDANVLIIAYIVSAAELDLVHLKRCLRQQLPDYMIPSHFQRIDKLPLTMNGKTDRKALPDPVLAAVSTYERHK